MLSYIDDEMRQGARFWHIARHMLGLFQGMPGARGYRRHLSENGHKQDATADTLVTALSFVR